MMFSQGKRRLLRLAAGLTWLLWPASSWAHGDIHLQILEVTQLIEKDPRNAELYLRRGELSRSHQDWDGSQADYQRAAELDPHMATIDLARGRMFLDANWAVSAKVALDRFLARHTNHVDALVTRARALVKLGRRLEGAYDYTVAITNATAPMPELYIERAQALAGEGKPHVDAALRGLDEGVKKLGPLVTLQLYAIELELRQGQHDGALARLDRVGEQSPRKESYLYRRGEILRQAGREAEARVAFEGGLQALDRLPPTRRRVPATMELERKILEALGRPSAAK